MSTEASVDARAARRLRLLKENSKARSPNKGRPTLLSPKSSNNVAPLRPVTPSSSRDLSPSPKGNGRMSFDVVPPISFSSFRSHASDAAVRLRSPNSSFVDDDMVDDEKKISPVAFPRGLLDQPTLDPITPDTSTDTSLDNLEDIVPDSPKEDPPSLGRLPVNVSPIRDSYNESRLPPSGRYSPTADGPDHGSSIVPRTKNSFNQEDEMLSSGGAEDGAFANSGDLARLANCFRDSQQPKNMSNEEQELWNTVQSRLDTMRTEYQARREKLEQQLQEAVEKMKDTEIEKNEMEKKIDDSNKQIALLRRSKAVNSMFKGNDSKVKELECSVRELETKLEEAQQGIRLMEEEHEQNIQAIRRVLADTNEQHNLMIDELNTEIQKMQNEKQELEETHKLGQDIETLMSKAETAAKLKNEVEILKRTLEDNEKASRNLKSDLKRKNVKITSLEEELTTVKEKLDLGCKNEEGLASSLRDREIQLEKLQNRIAILMPGGEEETANMESLVSELAEKKASLNTAKSIIASMENANSSLAIELRGKLKEKDDSLDQLKGELSYKQKTLDQLAIEMRGMQSRKNTGLTREQVKELAFEQCALRNKLESALSELRTAAAVHEAAAAAGSQDSEVIEQISSVLSQSLESLEATRLVSETTVNSRDHDEESSILSIAETDFSSTIGDTHSHDLSHHLSSIIQNDAAKELLEKLEQEKATVDRLQGKVRSQTLEIDQLRNEMNCAKEEKKKTEEALNANIVKLERNCRANSDVLAKKEREFAVLRDSLDVGEVGYISDASEGDEEVNGRDTISTNKPMYIDSLTYSHSKAEASATLLEDGGGSNVQKRLNKALKEKEITEKELEREQSALANAKMIISSLEIANKSMVEDLKARLNDSTSVITTLINKSKRHENISASLKTEVEMLKKEKETEEKAHKKELRKAKDEALVNRLKMEAKEKELELLRRQLARVSEEKEAIASDGCAEEKKEELEQV